MNSSKVDTGLKFLDKERLFFYFKNYYTYATA